MAKLQSLDRSKDKVTIFKDFLTLCTCSLAQPIYRSEKLEQRYLETVKQYTKEQAEEFSKLLALLVMAFSLVRFFKLIVTCPFKNIRG